MPSKIPDYIENDTALLKNVLSNLLADNDELAIAFGYFDLKGFVQVKDSLKKLKRFRLLLGTEPTIPRLNLSAVPTDFPEDDFKSVSWLPVDRLRSCKNGASGRH